MDINEYIDYKSKTIAEFKVAISEAEKMFFEHMKNKDIIGALEATKLKLKLESLLNQKIAHGTKHGYDTHTRK